MTACASSKAASGPIEEAPEATDRVASTFNHLSPASANVPTRASTKGYTVNWDIIEGDWMQFKGLVKQKWGRLTDDHLDTIAGKRDQLAGKLQEAYGITADQAEVQVKAFEKTHQDHQPDIVA